jgi:hypothetical protein
VKFFGQNDHIRRAVTVPALVPAENFRAIRASGRAAFLTIAPASAINIIAAAIEFCRFSPEIRGTGGFTMQSRFAHRILV